MPYSQFTTLKKAKDQFELQTIEGVRFLPAIEPISPSPRLMSQLEDIPWAIAVGSEKARSEAIIYPVLQEVRRVLELKVSLFSSEDFSVNESQGLKGISGTFSRCQRGHPRWHRTSSTAPQRLRETA